MTDTSTLERIAQIRLEERLGASRTGAFFPDLTRAQRRYNRRAQTRFLAYRALGKVTGSSLAAKGEVTFTAYDADGRLLDVSQVQRNLIVTTGKALVLDRLFTLAGATGITSVGVGTENTAALVGDTRLNPAGGGTVVVQTADAGTSRTTLTVTITATFGTGTANFAWAECGLFNGNVNATSTLFNRVIIGPFTKTVAVTIVLQFQITQA